MPERRCPNCEELVSSDSRFCELCGHATEMDSSEQELYYRRLNIEHEEELELQKEKERRQKEAGESVNKWMKGCGIGCLGLVALVVLIVAITAISDACNGSNTNSGTSGRELTDAQYSRVAGELTNYALAQNWCYKRDGTLDSRDGYVLTAYAEDIANHMFGNASYRINENRLVAKLLARNWSTFLGTDYDRGGTESRYRPPGCG